jgi:hypothetical protein
MPSRRVIWPWHLKDPSSTYWHLKMKAVCSLEMLGSSYSIMHCHIPEEHNAQVGIYSSSFQILMLVLSVGCNSVGVSHIFYLMLEQIRFCRFSLLECECYRINKAQKPRNSKSYCGLTQSSMLLDISMDKLGQWNNHVYDSNCFKHSGNYICHLL